VREHRLAVPVDWADPQAYPPIELFAREIVDPVRAGDDLPLLRFLQGGPGGQGPRPGGTGWWTTALATHRVVLVDQRGTGRSSRIDGRRIAAFESGDAAAAYLACFRADAIVADCEHLRAAVYGSRPWATLGQSYGGFVTLAYLSRHPEALTACYLTGGLPSLTADAEEVYRRTFVRQALRNDALAARYPDDVATLGRVADRLAAGDATRPAVVLPNGDPLTVERLQLLGMPFGMSTGIDALHWLLDTATIDTAAMDGAASEPTDAFCAAVAHQTGFDDNPLYAVLQEAIYHQGDRAGGWAAQAERDRRPELAPAARPLQLTGEAVFPWMFEQIRSLRPFRAAAEALAARRHWPDLYDVGRLASNDVPVAALQYVDDPYVDLDLALGTAGAVGNAQVWVTNEYLHDGLRVAADVILPRLIGLAAGTWHVS